MKAICGKPLRMTILSCPAHLPVVRAAVQRLCQIVGFAEEAAGNIMLSVDEALSNVIKHAYHGRDDQPIEIVLTVLGVGEPAGLQIELRDYGQWVDPARIKSRDLADVRPGGLGVHIMTECMDRVEFAPAEGGGTRLILTKSLSELVSNRQEKKT